MSTAAEGTEQDGTDKERRRKSRLIRGVLFGLIIAILAVGAVPFVSIPNSLSTSSSNQLSGLKEWWNESKRLIWDLDAPCPCPHLRDLTGVVEDCSCEYETVYTLNHNILHSLLHDLVKKPFFRYFKVKLWCDCPFWPEDGLCSLRDCSVCECPENEFPETFKKGEDISCQEGSALGVVDRTVDTRAFRGWMESVNPWMYDEQRDNSDLTYVNLLLNPERFTGYVGPSARKIWEAIYQENCFQDAERDSCMEARFLYRLISGLHTSISTHIAADYLLDQTTGTWGPNPSLLSERVLEHPERMQNLYFTFLFVLRAVTKAGDYLSQAEYNTGNPIEDQQTLQLMKELVNNERLRAACPLPFDEAQFWQRDDSVQLKQQLQFHFRNISSLMDCVGCEKCRLWGKLQTLGLAAALKILFSVEPNRPQSIVQLDLERNEVIALINLLQRLSESLQLVYDMAPGRAKKAMVF